MEEYNVIRIAIIAATRAYRVGLRELIRTTPGSIHPGVELDVLFDSTSLEDITPFLDKLDLLILEEQGFSSPELQNILFDHESSIGVLFLSDNPNFAVQLINIPIQSWGILALDCTARELNAAITAVHEGLITAPPSLLLPSIKQISGTSQDMIDPTLDALTERESQVLQLVAEGMANKQIALNLGISEHTVKFHISSIYTKLGVTNRTEAVRAGVINGLITF